MVTKNVGNPSAPSGPSHDHALEATQHTAMEEVHTSKEEVVGATTMTIKSEQPADDDTPASMHGTTSAPPSLPATPAHSNGDAVYNRSGFAIEPLAELEILESPSGVPYMHTKAKEGITHNVSSASPSTSVAATTASSSVHFPVYGTGTTYVTDPTAPSEVEEFEMAVDPTGEPYMRKKKGKEVARDNVSSVETAKGDENDPFVSGARPPHSDDAIHRPRPDRDLNEINAENAQAVFPPTACIFVANLPKDHTDEELGAALWKTFEQFGTVYPKVRRDHRGLPYAFCQFKDKAASEKAITEGRKLEIFGRMCRTEHAKVNRAVYLSRKTGGPISTAEARAILAGHGALEKLWHSSPTDLEMFRLPEGIWAQFAYYDDARDVVEKFKDNSQYRLEQPTLPEDLRGKFEASKSNRQVPQTPVRTNRLSTSWSAAGIARRSIWVGNLTPYVNTDNLRVIFSPFGNILATDIISRSSVYDGAIHAYVEFDTELAAIAALRVTAILHGLRINVERRLVDTPANRSSNVNSGTRVSSGSPLSRSFTNASTSTLVSGSAPSTPHSTPHSHNFTNAGPSGSGTRHNDHQHGMNGSTIVANGSDNGSTPSSAAMTRYPGYYPPTPYQPVAPYAIGTYLAPSQYNAGINGNFQHSFPAAPPPYYFQANYAYGSSAQLPDPSAGALPTVHENHTIH